MTNLRWVSAIGLLWVCSLMPEFGFAVIPVMDVAAITNLIKSYNQLKSQYQLLQTTFENAKQQLERANQLVNNSEGHYGFGDLLNQVGNYDWAPKTWSDTLHGLSGGNSVRYQELLRQYQDNYPHVSPADFVKGSDRAQARVYQQDIALNRAVMVNATYSFDNIQSHLKTIHHLSEQIEQAPNTKAAMDLNSRLIAEVAYLQIQELRMQTLLDQQLAQAQADTIASQTAGAQFNTLPKS